MSAHRVSVEELGEHWADVDALAEGEWIESILSLPTWNDICEELDWRTHLLQRQRYFSSRHHGRPGVYRLIGLEVEGDLTRPATLNRVCGRDPTGTLYIGKAGRLHQRLNQLRRQRFRHQVMEALASGPLLEMFPDGKLAVAVYFTGCNPRIVESDLILAYVSSFGDVPPLSYKR